MLYMSIGLFFFFSFFFYIDLSWVLHIMLMQFDFQLMSVLHVIKYKILFWTHYKHIKSIETL